MNLYERMSQVQSTNPYFSKDLQKARLANKFIGRGSDASSTHKYRVAAGEHGNCGVYEASDVVFVSAEGMRRGRLSAHLEEIALAVAQRASFVTDTAYNRNRPYNLGEREVAVFLESHGYRDNGTGIWRAA